MDRTRVGARLALLVLLAAGSDVHAQGIPGSEWKLVSSLPGTYIQDLSFFTGSIGYAAAGTGQILKTVDGGVTWSPVLNLTYPYYWYGVQTLNSSDVVISGFIDPVVGTGTQKAVVRWSHDAGATWSDDLVLNESTSDLPVWSHRVHFWNSSVGFVTTIAGSPDLFRTTTGGLQLSDWSELSVDPNDHWFGAQFSALPNGHVRMSGIDYCESLDQAATWHCRPSIDPISDWATFFLDDNRGWVGGGVTSVPTEGWLHLTVDGGATWSDRMLDGPWPIRSVIFVDPHNGWAVGGAGDSGGAYVSHDGGQTWSVELNAGSDLETCSTAEYHVICAGYDNASTSHVYARDYDHIRHGDFDEAATGGGF